MKKFSVAIIIGTRPEGIKLYPLIRNFKSRNCFETIVIATGQHDELIKQVFELFNFEPDYNFDLMHENQSLSALSYRLISSLTACFNQLKPDLVIVQGDTTSAFIAALSAYYTHTKIAHVEAGLRTFDKSAPFPEEINRTLISHIADFHFAPTENARANLINEGINSKNIVVTGNTIIDAIKLLLPEIKKKDK
ncbi:MAG: non-hydrolyzing UDP-N-acetylglucosamine 2-epimerase, partial [Candidatus Hodarchaeales archaeon]